MDGLDLFKKSLRSARKLKADVKNDLFVHLVDWHGTDSKALKDQLKGKHLRKKESDEDYLDDDDDDGDDGTDADELDGENQNQQDEDKYKSEFLVYAFGLDELGNSITIKIKDFKPYFFIKVPDNWQVYQMEIFIAYMKKKAYPAKYKNGLFKYELIKAKPYYHFTANDQFNFLKLMFYDHDAFKKWSYMFQKDIMIYGINSNRPYRYDLYESNINPMIRLSHIKELSPSGWIKLPANSYKILANDYQRQTCCQLEVEVNYRQIQPVQDRTSIPPILIAAYDIEADSSHGDFPIAKKTYQKLAQDIMTEWTQLMTQEVDGYTRPCPILAENPRAVLDKWLTLAFDDMYQNYNINRIVLEQDNIIIINKDSDLISDVLKICDKYCEYYNIELMEEWRIESLEKRGILGTKKSVQSIEEMAKTIEGNQVYKDALVEEVHAIFETHLPMIDFDVEPTSHYGLLAKQVCNEYSYRKCTNTVILKKDPKAWLSYVINLAFDPIFNSHNINRIYTKGNIKPKRETIVNMIPRIYQICQDGTALLIRKAKNKKDKASGFKASADESTASSSAQSAIAAAAAAKKVSPSKNKNKWTDKGRYNKQQDKESEETADSTEETLDMHVGALAKFLNDHLPPVEGDITIQIGTTYQRYGEKHPFLKHIITLNTCLPIDGVKLVEDEHKDISFPDRELLSGIKKIYKVITDDKKKIKDDAAIDQLPGLTEDICEFMDELFKNKDSEKLLKAMKDTKPQIKEQINALILNHNRIVQLGEDNSIVIVETYKTEKEVLMAWTKLIQESDPDVLIGYNVFGFDYRFLVERSEELDCMIDFTQLGRFKGLPQGLTEQNLSSSGLGENILYYIPMYGRVIADLYKVVQASHKLDMYNLNFVSKHFMYMSKNDLPPEQIFIKQKGSAEDRRTIAEYCLMDCILCNRLLNKLELITNNIGMSNVCMVPLSYLFLRGQGVKILSLVAMKCRQEGFLIPVLNKDQEEEDDGYEGAIVLQPKSQIYFEPVAVCDFNSLYPSCMISENLSHDSYVIPGSKYDNLPGYEYVDIEYDLYREEPIPGKKKTRKVKCGVKVCRFVQLPGENKSLLPRILQGLLKARKDTRKAQEAFPEGSFEWKVKEGLQLAYKVTANSLYGQVGAKTSAIYLKDIAACTTATGRKLIYFTKNYFESNYPGAEAVYGDSVVGDTPLLLLDKTTNKVVIKTIETLVEETMWIAYNEFKPGEPGLTDKQQGMCPYLVWSKGKWSPIKRVIRHKTKKDIYRVTTHTGTVDVTEDHSLLDKNLTIVKPKDCAIGTELYHSYPTQNEFGAAIGLSNYGGPPIHFNELYNRVYDFNTKAQKLTIEEREAYIFGFFYSDGSCGKYDCKSSGVKYSWALNNADMRLLNKCLTYLLDIERGKTSFKILDTLKSSAVYKLVPYGSIKHMVDKYRPLFYDKDKYKIIPDCILNGSYSIRLQFLIGYYSGDGSKCKNEKTKCIRLDNKGKIGSSQLYYLMRSFGYSCSINTRNDKPNIFRMTSTLGKQRQNPIAIKKKQLLYKDYTDYVYDLETEEGCFHAGVGEIVVKNTDSVFIKFDCRNTAGEKLYGLDAVFKSMELCMEGSLAISRQLKRPHNLDFEKAIWPFILITKKRYHGHYYTVYGGTKNYPNSMGIVLKRRDNAQIVKHIFGTVVNIIMKEHNIEKAMEKARSMAKELLDGKFGLDMFTITKTLKSYYKNPMQMAHNVLAMRIAKRDPGNKPQANDRIPYAYIKIPEGKEKGILQGERIETPAFIKEHNLGIDYKFYLTNQIMKPVSQIFQLVTDDLASLFYDSIRDYDYKIKGIRKITEWYTPTKIDRTQYFNLNKEIMAQLAEGGVFDTEISDEDEEDEDGETDIKMLDD